MKLRATAKKGMLRNSTSALQRKPSTQKTIPAMGTMIERLLVFVLPTRRRKPASDAIPATNVKLLSYVQPGRTNASTAPMRRKPKSGFI